MINEDGSSIPLEDELTFRGINSIRVKIYDLDCRTHLCDQMFELGAILSPTNLGVSELHRGHRILRFNAKKPLLINRQRAKENHE